MHFIYCHFLPLFISYRFQFLSLFSLIWLFCLLAAPTINDCDAISCRLTRVHSLWLTWLTSEMPDGELLISGFNLYRTDSSCGRVGGVGVYASAPLPPPLSTHPILPATIDALNLKFSLGATGCLLLVVVYRSPSS